MLDAPVAVVDEPFTGHTALPEGLVHTPPADAATSGSALTGTPTVLVAPAAWTLTATDTDGDRATLTFTIEVVDRLRERLKGINEAILPELSRAMTTSTLDAVSVRVVSEEGSGGLGPMTVDLKGEAWATRLLLGPAFELGVEGERRESRSERAGHGLMLRARTRW